MKRLTLLTLLTIHTLTATPFAITGNLQQGPSGQLIRVLGTGFFFYSTSPHSGGTKQVCGGQDLCFLEDTVRLPLGGDSSSILQYLGTTIEQSGEFPMFDTGRTDGLLTYRSEPFTFDPHNGYELGFIFTGLITGSLLGQDDPFVALNISGTGTLQYFPFEGDLVATFAGIASPVPEPSTMWMVVGAFGVLLTHKLGGRLFRSGSSASGRRRPYTRNI